MDDNFSTFNYGFPAIAGNHAKVLILGSMPSVKSLDLQQYYAHPRNAFWPIVGRLFNFDHTLPYLQRVEVLCRHRIAVWDVLKACHRHGSLDQHIDDITSISNDFNAFFTANKEVKAIYFNGRKAEAIFNKSIVATLDPDFLNIPRRCLPSTSPAHANLSFEQKLHAWQHIYSVLDE